ncbi:MAG: glycoside hydrolase family 28 protein [Defluviitaleaceae bacterium]|nr:glycoside hydrolase family 28 protein [Defluviitaleaceae bacterium]
MTCKSLLITSTSVTFELVNQAVYEVADPYDVWLNHQLVFKGISKNVCSLYGLQPDTTYEMNLVDSTGKRSSVNFQTATETICLPVRRFGAKGDGMTDDTLAIQAAIMACPKGGRVLISAGTYSVKTLFLKSHMTLEIAKGATLSYCMTAYEGAILPGYLSDSQNDDYYLGSWEGNPLDTYTALIQGIHVEQVNLIGEGLLEGNGVNWWEFPKVKRGAWRPRLLQLIHAKDVNVQGLTFQNSPSWTLHPLFSNHLNFLDLTIINPKDSPNTDGLNPESCRDVLIVGVYFSVGDDCIAIKSGKIYLGRRLKSASEAITIRNCSMNFGHGAVVIGSEMAGGVKNIWVSQCRFHETDRGLRIKTRRGRGQDGIIDGITVKNIHMEGVLVPFVINAFYFCDPDGHSDYVKTKDKLPVDDRTPYIGSLTFEAIRCTGIEISAGFFYGLPEQPIECLMLKNCDFAFAEDATSGYPAMMDDIPTYHRAGLMFNHVKTVMINRIQFQNVSGEKITLNHVEKVVMQHVDEKNGGQHH